MFEEPAVKAKHAEGEQMQHEDHNLYDSAEFWDFGAASGFEADQASCDDSACVAITPSSSFWGLSPSPDFPSTSDTSTASCCIASDVERTLDMALASGDQKLADLAIESALRFCSPPWVVRACTQLQQAGITPSSDRILSVVHTLCSERRIDLVVDLWQGLPTKIASECHGSMLEACTMAGDYQNAARIAKAANWVAPICSEGRHAFLALTRWFARHSDLDQAMICYRAVSSIEKVPTDIITHRVLLRAFARAGNMDQAEQLFHELQSVDMGVNSQVFGAMVRGFRALGDLDKAMKYFRAMQDKGMSPDVSLYDAILDGCLSRNLPGMLEQVLADMGSKGVAPSNATLVTLMRMYGQTRDVDSAVAVFSDWQRRHSFEADAKAYSALISVCLKSERLDLALSAYDQMVAADILPNVRAYEALIGSCMRQGMLDRAASITASAVGGRLSGAPSEPPDSPPAQQRTRSPGEVRPRIHLDVKCIESLLRLLGQRGLARSLGVPLLRMLQAAGVEVAQQLIDSLQEAAADHESSKRTGLHAEWAARRRERQLWRDFSRGSVGSAECAC